MGVIGDEVTIGVRVVPNVPLLETEPVEMAEKPLVHGIFRRGRATSQQPAGVRLEGELFDALQRPFGKHRLQCRPFRVIDVHLEIVDGRLQRG